MGRDGFWGWNRSREWSGPTQRPDPNRVDILDHQFVSLVFVDVDVGVEAVVTTSRNPFNESKRL